MTHKTQSIPLNVFDSKLAGSSNTSFFGSRDDSVKGNKSFSQELSRVRSAEKSRPANDTYSEPRKNRVDARSGESENIKSGPRDVSDSAKHKLPTETNKTVDETESSGKDSVAGSTSDSEQPGKAEGIEKFENKSNSSIVEIEEKPSNPETESADQIIAISVSHREASLPDIKADGIVTAEGSDADSGVVNSSSISSTSETVAPLLIMNDLETDAELLPAQLHARQDRLINVSRNLLNADTTGDSLITNAHKINTPVISDASQSSSAAFLAGVPKIQNDAKSGSTRDASKFSAAESIQVQSDTDSFLASSEQRQINKNTLDLQARLNAQQATDQVQAESQIADQLLQRKSLQQQTLAAGIANSSIAKTEASLPDNMFHTLSGGIVTAPVQQRTDSGSTQIATSPLNVHLLQTDAEKSMASNIRWMVDQNVKQAVVNVTPSGMGPITVSIGLENDQMNVSIVAAQGSTREAMESMLPRLRDQLISQGHDAVKVDVSDGKREQSGEGTNQQTADSGKKDEADSQNGETVGSIQPTLETEGSEVLITNELDGFARLNDTEQLQGSYDIYV